VARASRPVVEQYDAFISPSGARFEYAGGRLLRVVGHPTAIDQAKFVLHMACHAPVSVRVCGITIGGAK
jgi:hypothetical protein